MQIFQHLVAFGNYVITATSFGDPHFITFDGTPYTFNGHGEFWLVWAEDAIISGNDVTFKLQGRMQQPDHQPCRLMFDIYCLPANRFSSLDVTYTPWCKLR